MNARPGIAAVAALAALLAAQSPPPTAAAKPAESAAEAEARQLGNETAGGDAGVALARRGAAATAALLPFLAGSREWPPAEREAAQVRAVQVLQHLGPQALPAAEEMIRCLARSDWRAQQERIVAALARILPYAGDHRVDLERLLGDGCQEKGYFGKGEFFGVMSRLKFDATAPRATLVAGLEDPNPYVRELAAEALARDLDRQPPVGKERETLIATLQQACTADAPRNFEVKWLWNGNQASTSGGANCADAVHAAAAQALAVLAPSLPAVAPGLQRQLDEFEPRRRAEAARLLGGLGEAAASAVEALRAHLHDPDRGVVREVVTALGMLGPIAEQAAPDVEALTKDPDPQLAVRARAALARLRKP